MCYCRFIKVLLPAANILQLDFVSSSCADYLQKQLDPTNCLGIKAFADVHNCRELWLNSEKYIKRHYLYDQHLILYISQAWAY